MVLTHEYENQGIYLLSSKANRVQFGRMCIGLAGRLQTVIETLIIFNYLSFEAL
jgi:hypothetical protein